MTLEKLLNILCERGWKPFWYEQSFAKRWSYNSRYFFFDGWWDWITLRQIASKESWLWQFCVCEGLVEKNTEMVDDGVPTDDYAIGRYIQTWSSVWEDGIPLDDDWEVYSYYQDRDYLWWVIESALHDEWELEQFLLDNIKV